MSSEELSGEVLSGSCLCGEVRFTARGESQRFYHCHCSRCRKASGTGHASNIFLKGSLEWTGGEDRVQTYKVPDAERFSNSFCRNCGSRVPRALGNIGVVFIPAGSLDDEPAIAPQARVFTGSRTAWSCDGRALAEFSEYPG